ncbi:MAG: hypothetical protein ABSB65_04570 [Candidatus Acidiferrales bacterium]|jgi:hypothetical protein
MRPSTNISISNANAGDIVSRLASPALEVSHVSISDVLLRPRAKLKLAMSKLTAGKKVAQ